MYGLRGMGDTNPVPPNYCNNRFAWAIPNCWGFTRPAIYGDSYPSPPMPVPVGSTLPGGEAIPAVPPDAASPQLVGVNAGQIVQSISDQEIAATQAQNQDFFQNLNDSLNPPGGGGINWWLWGGLAFAGVLAISFVGGGSPRRYGR